MATPAAGRHAVTSWEALHAQMHLVNLNSTATSRESKYTFYSEAKHKQYEGKQESHIEKIHVHP